MRNILHELKTPITKGKLISDTLEEGRNKSILQRAFFTIGVFARRVCKA